jgi:hypothetical protein
VLLELASKLVAEGLAASLLRLPDRSDSMIWRPFDSADEGI